MAIYLQMKIASSIDPHVTRLLGRWLWILLTQTGVIPQSEKSLSLHPRRSSYLAGSARGLVTTLQAICDNHDGKGEHHGFRKYMCARTFRRDMQPFRAGLCPAFVERARHDLVVTLRFPSTRSREGAFPTFSSVS